MQLIKKVVLAGMLLLIIFLTGCLEIPLTSKKASNRSVALSNNQIIEQEFYVSDRNFSQLKILINNNYEEVNKFNINLKIFAKNQTKPLRSLSVETPIRQSRFIRLRFKPIENSKQQTYSIRLSNYNKKNEPLLIAYTKDGPPIKLGSETKKGKSLVAIPIVTAEPRMFFGSVLGRIFHDKLFFVLYFLGMLFIFTLLIFKFYKKRDSNG